MHHSKPKILLVGGGRFGRNHLQEWCKIAAGGEIDFLGVVVATHHSRLALAEEFHVPVFTALDDALLRQADGVDIATPSTTHAQLVRRCLAGAHIMVEKPLAHSTREAVQLHEMAQSLHRILMVGHVYRFHPVLRRLKQLLADLPTQPHAAEVVLINPMEPGAEQFDANLEILHPFDMLDYLLERTPDVLTGRRRELINLLSLRYPGPINASVRIGWEGAARRRTLDLYFPDRRIHCDFIFNTIEIHQRDNQVDKIFFPHRHQALNNELRHFVSIIRGDGGEYPDAALGARIVDIAARCRPRRKPHRPSVAVIGGGIFGITTAVELSQFCDITLFERHAKLMTEASYVNQWRHHSGFHYPRSYDTILEIQNSKDAFEEAYGEAVLRDAPAYYAVSAKAVEIPRERYIAACRNMGLKFQPEYPTPDQLDPAMVSVCVRTDEGVYDYAKLRDLATRRLEDCPSVRICRNTEVVYGAIDPDGSKRLTIKSEHGNHEESFDYLVNATYQNRNLVSRWFNFPLEPLRFDHIELLLLQADAPPVCATVIDAPFVSVIGTGTPGQFLLSQRYDMVLSSNVPADGMPPNWEKDVTNRESMLRHAVEYFPFLKRAQVLESRYVVRAVNAYAHDFDARPTVISEHGFGCWSVLGGKIITCVVNARDIAARIAAELRESSELAGATEVR